jgi:hypothetical protein
MSEFPKNMYKQTEAPITQLPSVVNAQPATSEPVTTGEFVRQRIQLAKDKYNAIPAETKQKWWQIAKGALVAVGIAFVAAMALLMRIFDSQNRK